MLVLVTGPVRSGKSDRAAALATASGRAVTVAATAALDRTDPEMAARVARHRADRPGAWRVVETALPAGPSLPDLLRSAGPDELILVDALGTWIAAEMLGREAAIESDPVGELAALDAHVAQLDAALGATRAAVVVVAEQTGWDVVPPSAAGRVFRDALGRATRRVADRALRVELVVAGRVLDLTQLASPLDDDVRWPAMGITAVNAARLPGGSPEGAG